MSSTIKIGDFSVTRIEEMLTPGFAPDYLFPDYDPQIMKEFPLLAQENFWNAPSGKVMSSMHSWLIRDGKRVILVDTGCGNRKPRALPMWQRFHMLELPYIETLDAEGVKPEDVTMVICTHLHIDHVGWNTRVEGDRYVPMFPNARYVFGKKEFDHWRSPTGGVTKLPQNIPVIEDSVMPVVEAGMVEFVDDDAEIFPGCELAPGPGHTAGQFMVKLTSGKDAGVFSGDILHQPMQIFRPSWNSAFCEEAEVARATRRTLLDYAADRNALIFPAHFGNPHTGKVKRTTKGFDFIPLD